MTRGLTGGLTGFIDPSDPPPPDGRQWQAVVEVPARAVPAFEVMLEDGTLALSTYELPAPSVPEERRVWMVEALYDGAPDAADLAGRVAEAARLAGLDPAPEVEIAPLQPADWVVMSLGKLPPVRAGRFYVYGSHDAGTVPLGRIHGLLIDAGQAFGTGQHATTKGCLLALNDIAKRGHRPRRMLDVGTGTGVLAMAGAAAFRAAALATDIDDVATRIAAENAGRNRLAPWVRILTAAGATHPSLRRAGPFDLITANILAGPLQRLAPDVVRLLAPGGWLVLSGLLDRQARAVLLRYVGRGLVHRRTYAIGEWRALVLRRLG